MARELGESQALVQKWWQKWRPDHPTPSDPSQTFAEVDLADGQRPTDPATAVDSFSRSTVNGITLEADWPIAVGGLAGLPEVPARVP